MAYREEVLADSPVAYYRLGEASGTTAADEVGTNAGTYINAPTLGVTGAVAANTAVAFDRTQSECVNLTTLGTLGASLGAATWEFWIKCTDTSAIGAVFGSFNTGTSQAVQVLLNSDSTGVYLAGSTYFFIRDTAGLQWQGVISTNIYDGQWHHVKWRPLTATTFQVRVDKVDQTVTYGLQQSPSSFVNFEFPLRLAARNLRGVTDNYISASLDEVAFYATGLSDTRSDAHFDAQSVGADPAINTNVSRTIGDVIRVRFEIQETAGQTASQAFKLRFSKNGAAYADVGTATDCRFTGSAMFVDGAATTDLMSSGTGTFVAGEGVTDAATGAISFPASGHTEFEFAVQLAGASAPGDTFDLRVYNADNTPLNAYTQTPRITAIAAPTPRVPKRRYICGNAMVRASRW